MTTSENKALTQLTLIVYISDILVSQCDLNFILGPKARSFHDYGQVPLCHLRDPDYLDSNLIWLRNICLQAKWQSAECKHHCQCSWPDRLYSNAEWSSYIYWRWIIHTNTCSASSQSRQDFRKLESCLNWNNTKCIASRLWIRSPQISVGTNSDFGTNTNTNSIRFLKMKLIWIRIVFILKIKTNTNTNSAIRS